MKPLLLVMPFLSQYNGRRASVNTRRSKCDNFWGVVIVDVPYDYIRIGQRSLKRESHCHLIDEHVQRFQIRIDSRRTVFCMRTRLLDPNLSLTGCKFQKESGHCLGFNERYYYNLETMSCKEFIYGGCQGNCNRYSSYKKCMKACHDYFHITPMQARIQGGSKGCKLQKEKGICKAYFERYYYDLETKSCKKFIYGGCKGNCNRYSSYKQCMKACHATSTLQLLGTRDSDYCNFTTVLEEEAPISGNNDSSA
uniref:BPTI/Kunitz inhibitor domain-containing protein n=1 Tax=Timema genevievae TaxID=629358 RepID=A0A7R9JXX3_TIMGE|nr:unnamed protein product [Timema genevievae]